MPPFRPMVDRFWEKVAQDPDGCWEWIGYKDRQGYGRLNVENTPKLAHRISYEINVGPIPEGLTLDHLCRNHACVRPEHLEPVTNKVNVLRGDSVAARNAAKTHCPQGHEYTPDNIYWHKRPWGVARDCRACVLEIRRRERAAQR